MFEMLNGLEVCKVKRTPILYSHSDLTIVIILK